MVKIVEINDSQFDTLVLKSSLPVLLECASPECIICKTMVARILEASEEYTSQMVFLRLNINDNKRWQDFGVRVIPTLLYFKGGMLVARQDVFPEVEEIREEIRRVIKSEAGAKDETAELKRAIDSEFAAIRFYKYVYGNAKNGTTRERFRRMRQESEVHKELLEGKLLELRGEVYAPSSRKSDEHDAKPQGFSLFGALKMAIKIEKKLLSTYKKFQKNKNMGDVEVFKKLIKEETGHLKELQREMKFAQNKELYSSLEMPGYPTWLNKVFE